MAENSGGAHCFKYGFTTNYVTGLEVVLPDGDVVRLGGKDSTAGLRPGRRVRRLRGDARHRHQDLAAGSAQAGVGAHARRLLRLHGPGRRGGLRDRRRRDRPGAIEMMDNLSIRAAEGATGAGNPVDAAPRWSWSSTVRGRVRGALRAGRRALRARGADWDARGRERGRARADLARAQGGLRRDGPDRAELLRAGLRDPAHAARRGARRDRGARAEHGLQVANVFHAGDGNLHPLVCYDGAKPGEAERAEELAGRIVQACVEAGGSITGEHGVGVDKKRYMPDDVRRARPRRVPAAALRVRPRPARQPGQGDADPAAVRRGAGPVSPATRSSRPGVAERF